MAIENRNSSTESQNTENTHRYVSSYEAQLLEGDQLTKVPAPNTDVEKERSRRRESSKRKKSVFAKRRRTNKSTSGDKAKQPSGLHIGLFQSHKGMKIGPFDLPFFLLLLGVSAVGLITLFSASYTSGFYKFGNPYKYIGSQALYSAAGIVGAVVISHIPYQKLHRLIVPLLGASLLLLALVPFIGTSLNTEAKRWLRIGPITFQPSEVAKAAVVIAFSSLCIRWRDRIKHPLTLLPFFAILGVMALFLLKQPHLSATIIILITGFAILFVGGGHIGYLSGILLTGAAGLAYLVFGPMHYQYDRIESWLDPFKDPLGQSYQLLQSLYAVGSGGLFGLGLGQSRQKQMYLPEAYNDFIFSIACEELGFIGASLIIILFAAFVLRGFYIALHSHDTFGTLLVVGFMTQIAVQVFLNIGVVTNLIPITGASLPFFSSGGTSALMLYAQMGVVLSVSRQMATQT